jgi:hypothetical protein
MVKLKITQYIKVKKKLNNVSLKGSSQQKVTLYIPSLKLNKK